MNVHHLLAQHSSSPSRRRLAAGARLARWRPTQGGATAVEMAILAPVFLLVIFGILEMSLMYFADLSMQYAVREGARYAVTGQSNLDPNAANQQRYLAVIQKIQSSSMGMYSMVNPVITVNKTAYASASAYNANMFGGPGDIVVLQLDCTWTLATPLLAQFFTGGKYHFTVAATMRNEIYAS
jgi:Flp pilus assembly protein TadG